MSWLLVWANIGNASSYLLFIRTGTVSSACIFEVFVVFGACRFPELTQITIGGAIRPADGLSTGDKRRTGRTARTYRTPPEM